MLPYGIIPFNGRQIIIKQNSRKYDELRSLAGNIPWGQYRMRMFQPIIYNGMSCYKLYPDNQYCSYTSSLSIKGYTCPCHANVTRHSHIRHMAIPQKNENMRWIARHCGQTRNYTAWCADVKWIHGNSGTLLTQVSLWLNDLDCAPTRKLSSKCLVKYL